MNEAITRQPEVRQGGKFVCNVCCEEGQFYYDKHSECVIFNCPDHLRLVIKDSQVIEAYTLGVRQ